MKRYFTWFSTKPTQNVESTKYLASCERTAKAWNEGKVKW